MTAIQTFLVSYSCWVSIGETNFGTTDSGSKSSKIWDFYFDGMKLNQEGKEKRKVSRRELGGTEKMKKDEPLR